MPRKAAPSDETGEDPVIDSNQEATTEQPLVLTSEIRKGVYHCDSCQVDISQAPRIRCAVCSDYDLCLDCFLVVQKTEDHDPATHGYRVCDATNYPLLVSTSNAVAAAAINTSASKASAALNSSNNSVSSASNSNNEERTTATEEKEESTTTTATSDVLEYTPPVDVDAARKSAIWTVEEDLRLLKGLEQYGLANWTEISELVGPHKNARRCMERYWDDFLGVYGKIIPEKVLVLEENSGKVEETEELKEEATRTEPSEEACTADATKIAESPSSKSPSTEHTRKEADQASDTPAITAVSSPDPSASSASALLYEDTPRTSKRRAALLRANSSSMTRPTKRYRILPVDDADINWPEPFLGPQKKPGELVGRDERARVEQQYLRAISNASDPASIRSEYVAQYPDYIFPPRPDELGHLPGAELAGYMPRRGDLDVEWDNEAETAVADLEFLPSDPDKELKVQVLQIYNERLAQREQRKQFLLSRQLYQYPQQQERLAKLPRDERDLVQRLRLVERFQTPQEHATLIRDVLHAKRLRKEIAVLQTYRRLGIKTLADVERYQCDQERHAWQRNKVGDQAAPTSSSLLWKQYKDRSKTGRKSVNREPGQGTREVKQEESLTDFGSIPGLAKKSSSDAKVDTTEAVKGSEAMDVDNKERHVATEGTQNEMHSKDVVNKEILSFSGSFKGQTRKYQGMLSTRELALCRSTELLPAQYLEIKKALIQESLQKGLIDKDSRRLLVTVDTERRGNVLDFMVRAGWVSNVVEGASP